jgi:hypothetical protein
MKIIRVFPRRTNATPSDNLAFVACPPPFYAEADEVHVSVVYTWDLQYADWLAEQWKHVAPVKIGGPALNQPSGGFIPGLYVKNGYVITSRGCDNKCWFCSVWKREPRIKELKINEGWNLLDDNILACSDDHIKAVFAMLKKQKRRVQFTGGLEAKKLKSWHVNLLADLKPQQMFFAYDTPDDYEPLVNASKMLIEAGFNRQSMRCYVLIGYHGDTIEASTKRLENTLKLGFFPMAMLWKDQNEFASHEWKTFQREWAKPAIIYSKLKSGCGQVMEIKTEIEHIQV